MAGAGANRDEKGMGICKTLKSLYDEAYDGGWHLKDAITGRCLLIHPGKLKNDVLLKTSPTCRISPRVKK